MTQPWDRSMDPGRRLDGRVALVTGAGAGDGLAGIGVATSVLFAAQGRAGWGRRHLVRARGTDPADDR